MDGFGFAPVNPMMAGGVTSLSPLGTGMASTFSPMGQSGFGGMSPAEARCAMGPQGMGTGLGGGMDQMLQSVMMQQQMLMMLVEILLAAMLGQMQNGFGGLGAASGMGGVPGVGGYGGGSGAAGGASSTSGGGASADTGPVSPGTAGLLSHANRMVGLDENRDTSAIEQVTGKSGINPASTPWCAAWAMNMLEMHGVLKLDGLSNRNYCPTVKSWGQGKQIWQEGGRYTPKAGDAILFDWEGDGTPDHIGIVEKVAGGKVYTIEGNSSDKVSKNSYDLGSGKIDGYLKT